MSNNTEGHQQASGLGLDDMGDLSSLLDSSQSGVADSGAWLDLPISSIDEDPNQPRTASNPGFSKGSIEELAATIRARKVKTPISVRPNPEEPGRYIINHGARRYRASIVAEQETIPAFVDPDYSEADQVIENLQRNDLTAREIADFIGRELSRKKKKGEIAKEIGKSASFVTQHANLLDLPEPLAEAFNSNRVKDVTVINELLTAYKKSPDEVKAWLSDDSQELTRATVKMLREFIDEKTRSEVEDDSQNDSQDGEAVEESDSISDVTDDGRDPNSIDAFDEPSDAGSEDEEHPSEDSSSSDQKDKKEDDPEKLKKAILLVEYHGQRARLMMNKRPSAEGRAWVKYEDSGEELDVDLESLKMLTLMES